ncbi:hypothetical protein IEC338SC_0684 [Acinetobacter pittii]|uniref:Uncharacterized protein n=1 Tax=Acinetobacter pittii TaxID=48296 RepID=A0AB33B8B5_ACIPI|nr:hypothetical protein [Acinetobacter pittii]AMX17853.1 hypothetical protein IEC338SC_0684 [Acinetobacter pittii]
MFSIFCRIRILFYHYVFYRYIFIKITEKFYNKASLISKLMKSTDSKFVLGTAIAKAQVTQFV